MASSMPPGPRMPLVRAMMTKSGSRRARGLAHLGRHQFQRQHVFSADMVVRALGQYLILDFYRGKTRGLGHAHGVMHVHWVAKTRRAVEYQRQIARGANVDAGLTQLRDVEIRFKTAVEIADSAAAEIQHLEAGGFGEFGAEWIKHSGRDQRAVAG